jgi:guanylate kinase
MAGKLIIISSPSGGGKGTLIREVLRTCPEISLSVSYTTRAKREGEIDGREYHFVTTEHFEGLIAQGEFLEYAHVHGKYYGTSEKQVGELIAQGKDVILEIDVQGAEAVLAKRPEAVSIFILPPSYSVLRSRLEARQTESPAQIDLRMKNALEEVKHYKSFKFVVENNDLSTAVRKIKSIIAGESPLEDGQETAVKAILDSFRA